MAVYKFRITFEDYDEVSRDIDIQATQTFDDLHRAILSAIGFDQKHSASFYMSNDHWIKGREIKITQESRKDDAILCDYIADPHQKIYYVYDLSVQWTFYIELIKIMKDDPSVNYPCCVKKTGDAPKQYGASALGAVSNEFDFLSEQVAEDGVDDDNDYDDDDSDENSGSEDSDEEEISLDDERNEDDY